MFDATASPSDLSLRQMTDQMFNWPYRERFGHIDEDRPGKDEIEDNYRGVMYRLLKIRADAIAMGVLQADVMRRTGPQEAEQTAPDFPWRTLIRRPNPNHSAYETWLWASLIRDLTGTADFIIDRNSAGLPIGMYQIFPVFGELRERADGTGGVDLYIFRRVDGTDIEIDPENIVRIAEVDPSDPHESSAILTKAGFEVATDWYASKYSRDLLRDGMHPPGHLEPSGDVNRGQEAIQRWAKQFARDYMGMESRNNVAGVPVLPPGYKMSKTPFAPSDLQLNDTREFNKDLLYEITGVPKIFSDDNNRANAEQMERNLIKFTIEPEVRAVTSQLEHAFERVFGVNEPGQLFIEVPNLMPEDPVEEQQLRKMRLETGQASPNEFREEDGLEPKEGLDQYFVNGMLIPIGGESVPDEEPDPPSPADE